MGYNYRETKPALIGAIMLAFVVYFAPRGQSKQATAQHENGTNNQLAMPSDQKHSQTKTETAGDDPPERNETPEWSLVIIGLVTAIVIGWQSWETRRSADALVSSERAWIEGEITEHNIVGVRRHMLTVRNKGKTPAHIFRYTIWHGPTRDNAKLSKRGFKTLTEPISVFVGGNETKVLRDDFDMDAIFSQEASQIANAEGIPQGAFWVSITYGIVIKGRKRRRRSTSFAYRYDLTFSTIKRDPDYDEYT